MYLCPACSEKTISFSRKWLASSSNPARCGNCGAGSAIQVATAAGYLGGSLVLLTLAGFAAVWLHSSLVFFLGFIGTAAWYLWQQHKAPLLVVAAAEQVTANRSAWLGLLASLFPFWFG